MLNYMKMGKDELVEKKEKLLEEFIFIQDTLDKYSKEKYNICCEIEAINLAIRKKTDKVESLD